MNIIIGIILFIIMGTVLYFCLRKEQPEVTRPAVPDTDWKAKLNKAYEILVAAHESLQAAEKEFEIRLGEVDKLVKEAIECGGADAEKQWQGMVAVIKERIEELRNKIDRELKRIEKQGQKLWNRLVKNLGRPLAFIVAGLLILLAGYLVACVIHGIKCI